MNNSYQGNHVRSIIDPKAPDQYRWLAKVYDRLAYLVFGNAILKAQQTILEAHAVELSQCKKILWIGGGTGCLLHYLLKLAPHAEIVYLESSASMLTQAIDHLKNQATAEDQTRISWIHQTHEWLFQDEKLRETSKKDRQFDVIITAFFLDVLPKEECCHLIRWGRAHATDWLLVDFIPQKRRWAHLFIGFMYWCFVITTGIKQREMLDLSALLRAEGWIPMHEPQQFARGLISAERFRVSQHSR